MSLKWEDPPTFTDRRRPASRWRVIAAGLRSRPGQWAVVAEYPLTGGVRPWNDASLIRTGRRVDMPKGEFEARVVTTGTARALYARYVGGAS